MLFVGRIIYEKANGMPINAIREFFSLAFKIMYNVIVNINIDGPCCHKARLAVDHADVQKANVRATNIALFLFKDKDAMRYINKVVKAIIKEATVNSAKQFSGLLTLNDITLSKLPGCI